MIFLKRVFALLFCAVIVIFSFSACGDKDKNDKNIIAFCTISINCESVLKNTDKLKEEKKEFVPQDGVILDETEVEIYEGDTVYEIFKRVCADNTCNARCPACTKGILSDVKYTPSYDSYYISGIHQIYEGDCGGYSGWLFKVNGECPSESMHKIKVSADDKIEIVYSCDGGADVGITY